MRHIISFLIVALSICKSATAQTGSQQTDQLIEKLQQKKAAAKDAADQKTNFKSIVTDLIGGRYYQALLKNGLLKQDNGEVQLKSTVYGLIRVFDSTKSEREYFKRLRWARNTQIGLGATMDEMNKITSLQSSFTVAILNKREYKGDGNIFDKSGITADELIAITEMLDPVDKKIEEEINNAPDGLKESVKKKYETLLADFSKTLDFSKFKGLISDIEIAAVNAKWNFLTSKYDSIQQKLSGAPLLTLGYDGNYNGKKWEKINTKIEFLTGLGNKKDSVKKYDLYAGIFGSFSQDTLNKLKVLNRSVFSAKFGVNAVIWKDKNDGSSLVEAFGGGEYEYINSGIYVGEKRKALKLDLSLSFRLTKNLYLPFQLKYNATSGRFEGYIDLKFDIVNIFN